MTRHILGIAALATATVTLPAGAQTPESVPYEVVRALFGHGGSLDITVGALPDPMPFDLTLPDDARVIASMRSRYGAGQVIAVALPGSRREVERTMDERLTASGWTRPELRSQQAGFVGSIAVGGGYCRDNGYLHLNLIPLDSETVVRFQYQDAASGSLCSDERRTRGPWRDAPMPTLTMPSGAFSRGGGMGGGEHSIEFSTRIETSNSIESLVTHFAGELTEQGWSGSPPLIDQNAALQRWGLTGTPWHGHMTIARLGDRSFDARFVMVDVDRAR